MLAYYDNKSTHYIIVELAPASSETSRSSIFGVAFMRDATGPKTHPERYPAAAFSYAYRTPRPARAYIHAVDNMRARVSISLLSYLSLTGTHTHTEILAVFPRHTRQDRKRAVN